MNCKACLKVALADIAEMTEYHLVQVQQRTGWSPTQAWTHLSIHHLCSSQGWMWSCMMVRMQHKPRARPLLCHLTQVIFAPSLPMGSLPLGTHPRLQPSLSISRVQLEHEHEQKQRRAAVIPIHSPSPSMMVQSPWQFQTPMMCLMYKRPQRHRLLSYYSHSMMRCAPQTC